jgi:hypothetical protein
VCRHWKIVTLSSLMLFKCFYNVLGGEVLRQFHLSRNDRNYRLSTSIIDFLPPFLILPFQGSRAIINFRRFSCKQTAREKSFYLENFLARIPVRRAPCWNSPIYLFHSIVRIINSHSHFLSTYVSTYFDAYK